MYYVYLLQSESRPKQPYVGSTRDLRQRLKDHNEGRSPHTAKFRPWILIAYFAFAQEQTDDCFREVSEVRFGTSIYQAALPLANRSLRLERSARRRLEPRKLSGLERVRRSFSEGGPPHHCHSDPAVAGEESLIISLCLRDA